MQLNITNIQVQDPSTLLVTVDPSNFVDSEQDIINSNNASVAAEIARQNSCNAAIVNFQNDIDGNQADVVASQTKIDALNADTALHQANIDAVVKDLPALAPVVG